MKPEDSKLVWSDQKGDLRSKKDEPKKNAAVDPQQVLKVRRVVAGKGRPVLEVSNLPANDDWCQKLVKDLKAHLACGGTYKNDAIEIHGEQFEKLTAFLDKKSIKWKKSGG